MTAVQICQVTGGKRVAVHFGWLRSSDFVILEGEQGAFPHPSPVDWARGHVTDRPTKAGRLFGVRPEQMKKERDMRAAAGTWRPLAVCLGGGGDGRSMRVRKSLRPRSQS